MSAVFLRLSKQVFLNGAVALILFFLPIEVLFRLSSWLLFMPVPDVLNEIAVMILLLALVAAGAALLAAGAGCVLIALSCRTAADKTEETASAVFAIGILAAIAIILLEALKIWFEKTTGIIAALGAARYLAMLLIVGICAVWAWNHGIRSAGSVIQLRLAKGSRIALALILAAGVMAGVNGIEMHDYEGVNANPVSPPRPGMPNVFLLTIDTLTAEDMSLYGYRLPTTPRLEAFAKQSYVFENFFASSNWTTPSIASLVSGLYPDTSGVHHSYGYFLQADRNKNLAQALKSAGYRTAAVVGNVAAHPLSIRISDSFSAVTEPPVPSYRASYSIRSLGANLYRLKNHLTYAWLKQIEASNFRNALRSNVDGNENSLWPPELVFQRALPFVDSLKQPNFIWAHITPPHSPYLPAAPFKYQFGNFKAFSTAGEFSGYEGEYSNSQQVQVDQLRQRYDEFILDTDSRVGDFLDRLKAAGRFDDSIIIITSDHGESFTRNYVTHSGPLLHQPLIHIPLLVYLPGQQHGQRIAAYAGQVDVLPTVMDLLDLPIPKWVEGESLKAAMLQGKPTSLPKFSMNLDHDSRFSRPGRGTVAVMQDGWKLVRYLATGKEELYHLASDPGETADLTNRNPEQAGRLRDLIQGRFKAAR